MKSVKPRSTLRCEFDKVVEILREQFPHGGELFHVFVQNYSSIGSGRNVRNPATHLEPENIFPVAVFTKNRGSTCALVDHISGAYFIDCKQAKPKPWAEDDEAAEKLWQLSEEYVGFRYPRVS